MTCSLIPRSRCFMAWNSVANVIETFFVCYIDLNAGRFNRWTAVIVRSWQIAEIDTNRIGVGATHHSHGCSARCVLYTHSNAIHAGQMCHYPLAFLAISRNVLTKSTKWFFLLNPIAKCMVNCNMHKWITLNCLWWGSEWYAWSIIVVSFVGR